MNYQAFQINLIKEKDGYTVTVPQLPGCVSFGETIEKAKKNAKQAIELHLECLKANGLLKSKSSIKQPVFSTFVEVSSAIK